MRLLSDLAGTLRTAFRVGRSALDASGLSAARTHALPDKSGTVALLDDLAAYAFDIVTVVATANGQTSFTIPGGYTVGAIVVALDGSFLAPVHYTASNGTTVVLASGDAVLIGNELLLMRFASFEVADAITAATLGSYLKTVGGSSLVGAGDIPVGMANPMTTVGDLIVGGTSGAPVRLAGASGAMEYLRRNAANNGYEWAAVPSVNEDQLASAWVNFNGTGTVAIRDSHNVSSVTDNGVGDYTVNFATAMNNANYAVSLAATGPSLANAQGISPQLDASTLPGVGAVRINHKIANSVGGVDPTTFCVTILGGK
jgi:hypothetical protein